MLPVVVRIRKVGTLTSFGILTALVVGCGAGAGVPAAGGTQTAKQVKLPAVMNWATLDVGSATYLQHTAIAHAVSGREKVTIRLIPSGSDVARNAMASQARVDFGVFGGGTSPIAFEGLTFFAGGPDLGPQPVRLVAVNFPPTNTLMVCAADLFTDRGAAPKTPMDVPRSARYVFIENAFGFNHSMEAWLAYAGLSANDVAWTPVPSFGTAARTVIEGRADCYWTATNTPQNQDLASSPRGWVPITLHKDAPKTQPDAWKRLKAVNPFQVYGLGTEGVPPISEKNPNYGNNSQFNGIETRPDKDPDLVYAKARAIYEAYDDFKDAVPGIKGFRLEIALERAKDSFFPYHEGLIRYLKERGLWNDEVDAHNQLLLKRERAWDRMLGEVAGKQLKKEDFEDQWMAIRAEELKKDGLDPYYEKVYWRARTVR